MVLFSRFSRPFLLIAVALSVVPCAAAHAAPSPNRSWVSGVGDDVNPCTRFAPCKTFPGAESKTPAGGTITALDPAGFGAVTITKALTLDGSGSFGSALTATGTNGVTVAAGANDDVTLRGIVVENQATCVGTGPGNGIRFVSGHSLRLENVVIRGFAGSGIDASPTTAGSSVTIDHSDLRDNCTAGVSVAPTGGPLPVTITNTTLTRDGSAIRAADGAQVRLGRDTISGNTAGLTTTGTGTISSFGDNHIAGNPAFGVAHDGAATGLLGSPPVIAPPPAPPAPTVTGPGGVVLIATHTTCTVPNLAKLTVKRARAAVTKAKCQLGTIAYTPRRGKTKNRIYAQQPAARKLQYRGAIVNVTINAHKPRPKPKRKAHKAALGGASRTWISGVGDDANPCSRTAPCKTLAGTISKTMTGGEIDVLDHADIVGASLPTINDAITIVGAGPAGTATITAGLNGITVNPTLSATSRDVTLENLTIVAKTPCSAPGPGNAINDIAGGGSLRLRNVAISGFAGAAVNIAPTADQFVSLDHVTATDNCTDGVVAQRPGGNVGVLIDGSTLRDNGVGLAAGDGATVRLAKTTISGNTTGLSTTGTGALSGWPDNDIFDNAGAGPALGPLGLQ